MVCAAAGLCAAQSLGDVARQERIKKGATPSASTHVVTNEDLPKPAAAASFRAVLRYQPNYANAHINLGDLLAQEGKDAKALEHLEEALRLSPGDERATKLASEIRKRILEKKK